MREIVLFIAMSLDGYIADINGKVDWLAGQDSDAENDDNYADFVKSIDTVIMGWTTYHQIVTELSPGQWVYDNLQSYVITHRNCTPKSNVTFVSENPCILVNGLKQKDGKDIWICGEASVGGVGHRLSFLSSSILSCSIFSLALAFLKFSPVMRTGVYISIKRS